MNRLREEKVDAAAVCLEGSWFQWLKVRRTVRLWAEFKKALILRFHEAERGSSNEMLMLLKQGNSVGEYIENFEVLSAPLQEASEDMLKVAFMTGLNPDIKADLRILPTGTLEELMGLARKVEARNKLAEKDREDFLIKHLKIAAATS